MKPVNYNKRSIILVFASLFNLTVCVLLFMGSDFLVGKGTDNFIAMKDLAKEKGLTVAEDLYSRFKTSDEVRKDPPEILAKMNQYDALKYDITLSFDYSQKKIKGDVILFAASVSDSLSLVYMNLYDNLQVVSVKYIADAKFDSTYSVPANNDQWQDASFKQDNNYLIIDPKTAIKSSQNFLVKISYTGSPKKLGFDSFSYKEFYGNPAIYNLSEPNYGPTWWPSKDLPEDKAYTEMHIIAPEGMTGVSNGKLISVNDNPDNTKTYNWKVSYPIATYLVSLVVTKLAYWEDSYTSVDGSQNMPLTYFVFPKDSIRSRTDWKNTGKMIGMLSKTFGEYPFIEDKYGMVQFGWTNGAMENQTITSMGYTLMTGDNTYDNVVVHELSHQWFGDAVTLKNWKNIWLNEGFASYCEALWEENQNGKQAYFDYMKNFDYGYFSGTVYAPNGFIDSPPIYATIYQKGAWVLHMLRGVLGDDTFFKAMREYYSRFKYKNAETSDFVDVFEEVSGRKLDWFFDEWVYKGTGRPKYEYSWKSEDFQGTNSGNYTIHLNIKQSQDDMDVYKMPVKVTILTEKGIKEFEVFNDKKDQAFTFVTESKPSDLQIDKDGWILKKISKGKY